MDSQINLEAYAQQRLRARIRDKQEANQRALARVLNIETLWNNFNSELEEDNQSQFERMEAEQSATNHAIRLLDENPCEELDPNAWSIAGKVIDEASLSGVPGLQIQVMVNEQIIDAAVSDIWGNFKLIIPEITEQTDFTFDVLSGAGVAFHRETRSLLPRIGELERLTFAVICEEPVQERLSAGQRARESVLADNELVEGRLENMQTGQTLLTQLGEVNRASLSTLIELLSSPPPDGFNGGGGNGGGNGGSPTSGTGLGGSGNGDGDSAGSGPGIDEEPVNPEGGGDELNTGIGQGPAPWVLALHVVDASGASVASVELGLASTNSPQEPFLTGTTDANGHFSTSLTTADLPPGSGEQFVAYVLDDGGRPLFNTQAIVDFQPGSLTSQRLVFETARPPEPDPAWIISGRVRRPRNASATGLEVVLLQPGSQEAVASARTGTRGQYELRITRAMAGSVQSFRLGVRDNREFIFQGRRLLSFQGGSQITENITTSR